MAKPRHQMARPTNKNSTPSVPVVDIHGEYDWVIVKKQKVTITIPALPVAEQSVMPYHRENQPNAKPRKAANAHSPCLDKPHFQRTSVSDGEKSISSNHEKALPVAKQPFHSPPVATISNPPRLDAPLHGRMSNNPLVDNVRYRRTQGICSASKLIKKSRTFLDANVLLNQSLRAINLERKLQRAGGLSRWLTSIGLDQFVKYFHGRSVNKFQLVNMTMKKLKDMGANAVGPRRKLMHAIDCLCQPYCFEAL